MTYETTVLRFLYQNNENFVEMQFCKIIRKTCTNMNKRSLRNIMHHKWNGKILNILKLLSEYYKMLGPQTILF